MTGSDADLGATYANGKKGSFYNPSVDFWRPLIRARRNPNSALGLALRTPTGDAGKPAWRLSDDHPEAKQWIPMFRPEAVVTED
jgi:hypothetical protein